MTVSSPPNAAGQPPRFTSGSTMRHVAVMSATGWIGLVAIFAVDFINLIYISMLGRQELTAAIGYSGALVLMLISVGIGVSIAGTALTSRALGARDVEKARRLASSSLVLAFVTLAVPSVFMIVFADAAVGLLGATGEARAEAAGFLRIYLLGMPLMGMGMMLGGILRAVGDARRAMNVTLSGAIATALLDPIFIFVFGLGLEGAAIVGVLSRIAFIAIGMYGVVRVHKLLATPTLSAVLGDLRPLAAIGVPAIVTNLATPVANAFMTSIIGHHGDAAVAGWAVVDRLVPVAFGGVFALTGAIGPILGQNLGAKLHGRLRQAVRDSLLLTIVYCMVVWMLLAILAGPLARQFGLSGDGLLLFNFFCWTSGTFVFVGLLFVANSVFNNLGAPVLSMAFTWGRATLGTIPFVWIGSIWWGVIGVMVGSALGTAVFGIAAVLICFGYLTKLEARAAKAVPVA